jgi:hypothetical protein
VPEPNLHPRRAVLKRLAAGALAAPAAGLRAEAALLPSIKLGKYDVTRLIAGYNPIGGYSHTTQKLDTLMREWFTPERTLEYVRRCEQNGINTWQAGMDKKVIAALRQAWDSGSKMQWICLTGDVSPAQWKEIADLKPIAIVHHGEETDKLFNTAGEERIRDFIRKAHDHGVLAGVSSHRPRNILRVEDSNWGQDLYMTCFHEIRRDLDKVRQGLGDDPIGELYLRQDPERMTEVVRKVSRPCLGFKILAAGRLCTNRTSIEKAFQFAFANIKKTDAVIVGMFPVVSDEISEDAALARKYAAATG